MTKQSRVRRWRVRVRIDTGAPDNVLEVYAVNKFDARLIAFAMGHGFPVARDRMTRDDVETALAATLVL